MSELTSKKLDLLPCPFCGSAVEFEEIKDRGSSFVWWSVGCKLKFTESDEDDSCCGYQSLKKYSRKSDAAAAWNKRHTHEPKVCPHGVRWPHECKDCAYSTQPPGDGRHMTPLELKALRLLHDERETLREAVRLLDKYSPCTDPETKAFLAGMRCNGRIGPDEYCEKHRGHPGQCGFTPTKRTSPDADYPSNSLFPDSSAGEGRG